MRANAWQIVLLAFLPLALRTILYLLAFKVRSIHVKLISSMVIAGAPYLLGFLPIPLPLFVHRAASIGLAMFLMSRYTEAELYPDIIAIPLIVEVASPFLTEFVLSPIIE